MIKPKQKCILTQVKLALAMPSLQLSLLAVKLRINTHRENDLYNRASEDFYF